MAYVDEKHDVQVFWYFLTCTNVIVAAQLILGGSAVISTLTGQPAALLQPYI